MFDDLQPETKMHLHKHLIINITNTCKPFSNAESLKFIHHIYTQPVSLTIADEYFIIYVLALLADINVTFLFSNFSWLIEDDFYFVL